MDIWNGLIEVSHISVEFCQSIPRILILLINQNHDNYGKEEFLALMGLPDDSENVM